MYNGYWIMAVNKYAYRFFFLFFLVAWHCGVPQEGKSLYTENCVNCHMADGSGLPGIIPAINASLVIKGPYQELACLLYNGRQPADTIKSFVAMPSFKTLTETQITNLINYVKKEWTEDPQFVSEQEVAAAVKACQ